jgi:NAD(P)-dependent dehydrogenase (short-subunit alcohol dehydrogenase family)
VTPVAAVTGASSGIGRETAVALADRGYKVVLVVRDPARGAQAARRIARRVPPGLVPDVVVADLEDLRSVALAARRLLASHPRLDVLVNNAGILVPERMLTADGFERTFQVNHLAHFALTRLLEPALRAAPAARVVTVASDLHRSGVFDPDNLNAERDWDPWRAYCNSKLLNVMFSAELARRLSGTPVTSNAVHPGVVASGFGREMLGGAAGPGNVFQPFGAPPAMGARGSVRLATDEALGNDTGLYFEELSFSKPSAAASDPDAAALLWQLSEDLLSRTPARSPVPAPGVP